MTTKTFVVGAALVGVMTASASAGIIVDYIDASGLSAQAEFTIINPTTLQVRLRNTSTANHPNGLMDPSDNLLTGVSWDFGPFGVGGVTITGGTVFTGPTSFSLNFDSGDVGANADVSGEYGYSNINGTGLLQNHFSTIAALTTPFGGPNLDGPPGLNGPQAGLHAAFFVGQVPLGPALGAIQDEIITTLTLSGAITEADLLMDLKNNGSIVEFGSDAFFIVGQIPGPGALALLALAGGFAGRRRRRA